MAVVCKTGNGYSRSPAVSRCASRLRPSPRPARRTAGRGRSRARCCAGSASARIRTRPACIGASTSERPRASRWSLPQAGSCPFPGRCRQAAGHSRFGPPAASPQRCFISAPSASGAVRLWPKATSWAPSARAACLSCLFRTCTSAYAAPPTRRATSTRFSCCRRPRPIRPPFLPSLFPQRPRLRSSPLSFRLRLPHRLFRPPTRRLRLLPHDVSRPREVVRARTCAGCRIPSRSARRQLRCRLSGLLRRTRAVRRRRSPAGRSRLGVHTCGRARRSAALSLGPARGFPAFRGQGRPSRLGLPLSSGIFRGFGHATCRRA